jgi:5-methylcytosine-specific restriction endonuclease McrA
MPDRKCTGCGAGIPDDIHRNATLCPECKADRRIRRPQVCADCGAEVISAAQKLVRCRPCIDQRAADRSERIREQRIAWKAANRHKIRIYAANRRKREASNSGSVKVFERDWLRMLRRHDFRCAYCGIKPEKIHMDHVVPLKKGGRTSIGNVLPSCQHCNNTKSAMFLYAWKMKRRCEAEVAA